MVESFNDYLHHVSDKDLFFNYIQDLDLAGYQKWGFTENYVRPVMSGFNRFRGRSLTVWNQFTRVPK